MGFKSRMSEHNPKTAARTAQNMSGSESICRHLAGSIYRDQDRVSVGVTAREPVPRRVSCKLIAFPLDYTSIEVVALFQFMQADSSDARRPSCEPICLSWDMATIRDKVGYLETLPIDLLYAHLDVSFIFNHLNAMNGGPNFSSVTPPGKKRFITVRLESLAAIWPVCTE